MYQASRNTVKGAAVLRLETSSEKYDLDKGKITSVSQSAGSCVGHSYFSLSVDLSGVSTTSQVPGEHEVLQASHRVHSKVNFTRSIDLREAEKAVS